MCHVDVPYLNHLLNKRPVALPTARRTIRFPALPFCTALTSPSSQASQYSRPRALFSDIHQFLNSTGDSNVKEVRFLFLLPLGFRYRVRHRTTFGLQQEHTLGF